MAGIPPQFGIIHFILIFVVVTGKLNDAKLVEAVIDLFVSHIVRLINPHEAKVFSLN